MGVKIFIPVGTKFGLLTVIKELSIEEKKSLNLKSKSVRYLCSCECGGNTTTTGVKLRSGHTKTCGCSRNSPNPNARFLAIYQTYKIRANKKKIDFSLNENSFKELITNNCHYCNEPPNNLSKLKLKTYLEPFYYNGIDRVDSSKGYVLNNCVPCCEQCNRMKLDWTQEEFLKQIEAIVNYDKLTRSK